MRITPKQRAEIFKKSLTGKSIKELSVEYGISEAYTKTIIYQQKRMDPKEVNTEQLIPPNNTHLRGALSDNSGRRTMTLKQENKILKIMYADLAIKLWGRDFPDMDNL